MKNLKLSQGFNNAWFIHQNNKLILGSHDEQLLREILVFLENKDKFKHLLENQPKQEKLFDNTI